MFKYDSVHGRFKGTVEAKDGKLVINGKQVLLSLLREIPRPFRGLHRGGVYRRVYCESFMN
jgi:hypothetical protein